MLRLIALAWLAFVAVGLVSAETAGRELKVFTWPEYFEPALLEQFGKAHNVTVREVWYDDDVAKDAEFFRYQQDRVDVIVSSGATLLPYLQVGALAPLRTLPARDELEPVVVRGAYEQIHGYAVPYTWGTLGVAYRSDLTRQRFDSWAELFDPATELQGKIVMLADDEDLHGVVAVALGYPPRRLSASQRHDVQQLLLAQRPSVASYHYMDPDPDAGLVTGEAVAALVYNGDALVMPQYQPAIRYAVPAEGAVLWVDYLAVNASAPQAELAQAFVEFMSRPEASKINAEYLSFASPWRKTRALLAPAMVANPLIYPPAEQMASLHFAGPVSAEDKKQYQRLLQSLLR